MKSIFCLSVLFLTTLFSNAAQSVTLAWDANCATNVQSYVLFYGTTNSTTPYTNFVAAYVSDCNIPVPASTNIYRGSYTNTNTVLGRLNNSVTLTNLAPNTTYAFVVVSSDGNLQSDFSSELLYTTPLIPPPAPVNLRFK